MHGRTFSQDYNYLIIFKKKTLEKEPSYMHCVAVIDSSSSTLLPMNENQTSSDFLNIVRNNLWISSPECCGYLIKKSSNWLLKSSLLFRGGKWSKKWVSLHGSELVYMSEKPKSDSTTSIRIRRASITAETSIICDDVNLDGDEGFGFVVNFYVEGMPEWHFRAELKEERENWLVKLNQAQAIAKWLSEYQRVKILGIGGQGIVYELLHLSSSRHFAMKEIEINSERQMASAVAEAKFLKLIVEKVAHPNILHIEKVFQVGSKFYMVFPLCTGGELYDAVVAKGHFTEQDAAKIFREIMGALEALHEQNILHLDIKPENILFESREPNAKVFVTDFGLSKFSSELAKQGAFDEDEFNRRREHCMKLDEISTEFVRGTYGYMSPEVILMGYSSAAADVFAAGVVLYILLSGYPPFHHRSNREKMISTVSGYYRLSGEEWDFISNEAKDLIKRMLETDPLKRITAKEVLQHPWLVNIDDDSIPSMVSKQSLRTSFSQSLVGNNTEAADKLLQVVSRSGNSSATEECNVPSIQTPNSGSRHTNLSTAVSNLAGHVQSLKSERLAATIAKFLSAAGSKAAGYSHLATQYLYPLKSSASSKWNPTNNNHQNPPSGSALSAAVGEAGAASDAQEVPTTPLDADASAYSKEQMAKLVDKEIHHALARVIFHYFGTDGILSIEQFLTLRRHFGFQSLSALSSPGNFLNAGDIVLIQMIDRDGDGSISLEDLMSAYVGVSQLQEPYLRIIFRMYTESLWYFGQKLNYRHAMQQWHNQAKEYQQQQQQQHSQQTEQQMQDDNNASHQDSVAEVKSVTVEDGSSGSKSLVSRTFVNPPRYITAKNVSAIFEQLGYDPEAGAKVFDVLCEALQRIRHTHEHHQPEDMQAPILEEDESVDDDTVDVTVKVDSNRVATPVESNRAASQDAQKEAQIVALGSDITDLPNTSSPTIRQKISFGRPFLFRSPLQTTRITQMDVNDFIRAAHIDNVLVQVFFSQTHTKINELIQRAKARLSAEKDAQATIPPEKRTEISLERIFEEDIARQFGN